MDQPDASLPRRIKQLAAEAGYDDCGIAGAEPFVEFGNALEARMRRFPEARALYEKMLWRTDPRHNAAWVNSIVVCIRRYGKYRIPENAVGVIGRNYLCDSRFKDCPDHAISVRMKEGLARLGLRAAKGGVPDRPAAARAGVASVGRNCFAYSRRHGSWVNIECWRVDAMLQPDSPAAEDPCPSGCRECIKGCPTGALVEPFVMRMDRCIAHLTYGAAAAPEPRLRAAMGRWVYGCDACQTACPLNRGKWEPLEAAHWMTEIAALLELPALASMDQRTYEEIIHPRFWYIPKADLRRWRDNAKRALETAPAAGTGGGN